MALRSVAPLCRAALFCEHRSAHRSAHRIRTSTTSRYRCSAGPMLRRSDAPLGRYAPRPHLRDVALTPLELGFNYL